MSLNDITEDLRFLMNDVGHRELSAREYIQYAKELFVHETPLTFNDLKPEYPTTNGQIDLLVPCVLEDDAGNQKNVVYVWEIKSPQTSIFCFDTQNRVKPTPELVKAENQLLHYFEECKLNQQFRNVFNIVDPEDVKLGGILIGRKETLVKNHRSYTEETKKQLYKKARNYRIKHFYEPSSIKLLTWDRVLSQLGTTTVPQQNPIDIGEISITSNEEQ